MNIGRVSRVGHDGRGGLKIRGCGVGSEITDIIFVVKLRKFYKSAVSGKFVTKRTLKRSPKTTITQRAKPRRRP